MKGGRGLVEFSPLSFFYGLTVRTHRMGNYTDLTIYHRLQCAHLVVKEPYYVSKPQKEVNHGKPHGGEFVESLRRFFWRIAKFTILAQQRIGCLLQRQKDLICVGKHQSEPRTNVNCNF